MTDLTNHPDDSSLDPWTLESLLDGDEPAVDDAAAPLAALIASTRRPGDAFELRGAAEMLAAFREATAVEERVSAPTRRIAMLSTITRSKLIVAATAGALTLGAASAAAMTNSLPDSAQNVAHSLLKFAPAAEGHTAVGPDATGPAAKGLCTAWAAHVASGEMPSEHSVAFRNLAAAAVAAASADTDSTGTDSTDAGATDADPTAAAITTYCAPFLTQAAAEESSTEKTADSAKTDDGTSTKATAKGQQTTHPGQGEAQWAAHGRTDRAFPGKGASHWPKADGKPGNGPKATSQDSDGSEDGSATEGRTDSDTQSRTKSEDSADN
jgi:hypothetical protein